MDKSADFEKLCDSELIELAQSGDGAAVEFLLDKYRNFVRTKSRTYFLIGADREDIIQEGMIGLYKAIRDYKHDSGSSFRSFADLCITRQIITAIKTATRQKHIPLNSYVSLNKPAYDGDGENTVMDSVVESRFDPEEIMINRERFALLERELLSDLSKYEGEVLRRYLDGKSYTEIAARLGKSEKSIDNALQRIRKKMERLVKNMEDSN